MIPRIPHPAQHQTSLFFGGVLCGYLLLSPLYLLPSGLPQPADLIMLIGIIGMAAYIIQSRAHTVNKTIAIGLMFIGYAALINLINFSVQSDPRFVLAILFYSYNFLVFCLITLAFSRYTRQMQRWSYLVVIAVIIAQGCFILIAGPDRGRFEGTFNNPNQLSYWSLLSACMLAILKKKDGLNTLDLIALLIVGYIQTQTLSKAGMIVYVIFMTGLMLTPLLRRHFKVIIIIVGLAASITLLSQPDKLTNLISQNKTIDRAVDRLGTIGQQNDDSLQGRGYDRIWRYSEYLILGAGEGAYHRFTIDGRNKELHSGIATLLFSYGIAGTALFSAFIFLIFNRKSWYLLFFFALLMAYGVTHQNIRFTHFWIFLALVHVSPLLMPMAKRRASVPVTRRAHA